MNNATAKCRFAIHVGSFLALLLIIPSTAGRAQREAFPLTLSLDYGDTPHWDENNDGIAPRSEGVDITVASTNNEHAFSKHNLCTVWETASLETLDKSHYCSGSSTCCSFVGFTSNGQDWDSVYYGFHGKRGATANNIISARVVHVDYNLGKEAPYSNTFFSDWGHIFVQYQNTSSLDEQNDIDVTISMPPPFARTKDWFTIEVVFTNFGRTKITDLPVAVIRNPCLQARNHPIPLNPYTLTLDPGEQQTISIPYKITPLCTFREFIRVVTGNGIVTRLPAAAP